jgi:hypothetical protein
MNLRNIHNRKEYLKLYEFGGDKGGVGTSDGFANSTAWKDSIVGGLINGMFKSIGWLWRKSKEFFVISRLIAKITNELMRGVIVFCLENNINLSTGIQSSGTTTDTKDDFEKIKKDCVDNYQFDPKSDTIPTVLSASTVLSSSSVLSASTVLSACTVLPMDQIVSLLPDPDIETNSNAAHDFLEEYVDEYNIMSDEDKKKMQMIYMQYAIIKAAISTKYHIDESLLYEAIAKISTGDSNAGSISMSKSISGKVTVSDILTQRDRDKYKDDKEQMDLDIKSVNLAEIEKTIQKLNNAGTSESKNVKDEVASDVNIENLKVIQLTARELLQPRESSDGKTDDKSSLKLKWDKKLSVVYAGFTNLMTIKLVDIRETDFQTKLDGDDKIIKKGKAGSAALGFQKKIGETIDSLGTLIEPEELSLSKLAGGWTYYCFTYNGVGYMSSMAPVAGTLTYTKGYYLYMITRTFSKIDVPRHSIDHTDTNFSKIFKAINIGIAPVTTGYMKNVFFMVKKNAKFPTGRSDGRPNKTIILNYITESTGLNGKFYLCKPKDGKFNNCDELNNTLLTDPSFSIANYTKLIETNSCHKFTNEVFPDWQTEFKLFNSGPKKCDFTYATGIPFWSTYQPILEQLAAKLV